MSNNEELNKIEDLKPVIENNEELNPSKVEKEAKDTVNSETEKSLANNEKLAENSEFKEIVGETKKEITELKQTTEGKLSNLEQFPEGHIMNPKMLEKIAQMEAVDPDTLEFNQQRYDDYINKQGQLGAYSVGENQKKLQKIIDAGKKIKGYYDTEVIYGQGGWNRYPINQITGEVFLSRGSSNTTGSKEYKDKLAQKAKELGLKVEGQE